MTHAVAYSVEVIRRCRELPRAGGWPVDDPQVGTGQVGSLDGGHDDPRAGAAGRQR